MSLARAFVWPIARIDARLLIVATIGMLAACGGCGRASSIAPADQTAAEPTRSTSSTAASSALPQSAFTEQADLANGSIAVSQAARGTIESTPLAPRAEGPGDRLFELIDARASGIDFYHKWNEQLGQNRNTATGSGVAMG